MDCESVIVLIPDSGKPVPGSTINYRKIKEAGGNSIPVSFQQLLQEEQAVNAIAGYTCQNRPIEMYCFPGTTGKRALIVGGMHGSELSSIEIVQALLVKLRNIASALG